MEYREAMSLLGRLKLDRQQRVAELDAVKCIEELLLMAEKYVELHEKYGKEESEIKEKIAKLNQELTNAQTANKKQLAEAKERINKEVEELTAKKNALVGVVEQEQARVNAEVKKLQAQEAETKRKYAEVKEKYDKAVEAFESFKKAHNLA